MSAKSDSTFLGVVQFIHPGAEHKVGSDGWTPWNTTLHRRKFMTVHGSSVDKSGAEQRSELNFWGEWEAPSQLLETWESGERTLPRYRVRPTYPGPAAPTPGLQNTDPYVFGNRFKYTLCKQARKTGRRTFLANLAPGTLILFGSSLLGRFVLDTAFIVSENIVTHNKSTWEQATTGEGNVYRDVTLRPMYWDRNVKAETDFSLYSGASFASRFNGSYSFFPCQRTDASGSRFARPTLDLKGIVNHALIIGQRRTALPLAQIQEVWESVRSQVLDAGLLLGVSADEPKQSTVPSHLWPH